MSSLILLVETVSINSALEKDLHVYDIVNVTTKNVSYFQFVAHPSCQKKLTTYWYGDFFHTFSRLPGWMLSMNALLVAFIYPVCAVLYWIMPNTKVGHIFACYFLKMLKCHYPGSILNIQLHYLFGTTDSDLETCCRHL